MKKLEIVSNYHELCGISDYTERIEPELRKIYDVTILRLNSAVLKSDDRRMIKLGNKLIEEMADQLDSFDCVNIQFEAGLYGPHSKIIKKRIVKLIRKSKNLIFTFHSVHLEVPKPNIKNLFGKTIFREIGHYFSARNLFLLYDSIVKEVKRVDLDKNRKANIIVHDKKSANFISNAYGFRNVYRHPLGLDNANSRNHGFSEKEYFEFRENYNVKKEDKVIGLFGFVSEYKGHLTAVKALDYLPDNYVIMIFGAQHPDSVRPFAKIDSYLGSLLNYIQEDDNKKKKNKNSGRLLSDRITFVGSISNEEFSRAMRCCDFVALPHMEVGQMASGVAAMAIENHARALFSNTKCFHALKEDFEGCYETFDVGNYMQLASKILNYDDNHNKYIDEALKIHNIENNVKLYTEIFERDKNV